MPEGVIRCADCLNKNSNEARYCAYGLLKKETKRKCMYYKVGLLMEVELKREVLLEHILNLYRDMRLLKDRIRKLERRRRK